MDPGERETLLAGIWQRVDPRLRPQLEAEFERAPSSGIAVSGRRLVLVGHRAAGKSWLLHHVAAWVGLPGFDLDQVIEARTGQRVAEWLPRDAVGFRAAERAQFGALPRPAVVAAGGGFLSLHADLLAPELAVLVQADPSRPRLRPHLSLEAELREVFAEREALHAAAPTVRLPALLKALAGK